MERLTIAMPDDFHVHYRTGKMLRAVAPLTAQHFSRALVMPNTVPPISNAYEAWAYRRKILEAVPEGHYPLMTIKLAASTTPRIIVEAKAVGVIAAKLYPEGVTTNSEDGVRDFQSLWPVFAAMEEIGMVLCLHGEHPDAFILDREEKFLPILEQIHNGFPMLRIVLEHISTAMAAATVLAMPETVAATITVHHLVLTLDDVLAPKIQPHHFCMPVAKRPIDRLSLRTLAAGGGRRLFLGTDSAPHPQHDKECACGCAGVFTAPVALAVLAQVFEEEGALDRLEQFVSVNGANFYGLPQNEGKLTLVQKPWVVPEKYGDVVPFMAGQTLNWQVEES